MKNSDSRRRLLEMMQILNISQTDIVKRTGVQKSSLSNYVNGKRTPTQDQLSKIADPYGINPAWLMGYDVPMKTPKSVTISGHDDGEIICMTSLPYSEDEQKARELFELYEQASPDVQRAVELILRSSQQNS